MTRAEITLDGPCTYVSGLVLVRDRTDGVRWYVETEDGWRLIDVPLSEIPQSVLDAIEEAEARAEEFGNESPRALVRRGDETFVDRLNEEQRRSA